MAVQRALNDRKLILDLRVERDQLLSDKEALYIQFSNQRAFSNGQHEQITALQEQVEELRQTAEFLSIKFQQVQFDSVNSPTESTSSTQAPDTTALSPSSE